MLKKLKFKRQPFPPIFQSGQWRVICGLTKLCFRVVFSETEEVIPTKMKLMQGPLVAKLVNQNQNHP
jgi:hypothetical protein